MWLGEGWKIALLLNSSKFCRALFAFPVLIQFPRAGQRLRSSGDLSRFQGKNKKGKRPVNGKTTAPTSRPTQTC